MLRGPYATSFQPHKCYEGSLIIAGDIADWLDAKLDAGYLDAFEIVDELVDELRKYRPGERE
jgi:hypothetical protein